MKFEKLPEDIQEDVKSLKHGSNTIECDILDAIEEAENLPDFRVRTIAKMQMLINECNETIKIFDKEM